MEWGRNAALTSERSTVRVAWIGHMYLKFSQLFFISCFFSLLLLGTHGPHGSPALFDGGGKGLICCFVSGLAAFRTGTMPRQEEGEAKHYLTIRILRLVTNCSCCKQTYTHEILTNDDTAYNLFCRLCDA